MKNGMTGAGGLSRKLLATLIVAAMPGLGLANEVYIEQIGENTDVTINQTGTSNVIKGTGVGSTDPAYVGGSGNTIQIDQIGVNNVLKLSINDGSGSGAGTGTSVTVNTDGSDNDQTIVCGTSLTASCNAGVISTTILGDSNTTIQTLNATGKNTSTIDVRGDNNTVKHTTAGSGSFTRTATITVNGTGGAGTAGTGNYVEVNQSGAQNRVATVTSSGNNNSVIINQTGQ